MKRVLLNLGAVVLAAIPITSILLMWEVVNIPRDAMGWFVVSYLTLVLILLLRLILIDLWRWWRGDGASE